MRLNRQIVLDTETTGLDPKQNHRIIEIGCVEMIDRKLTGRHFHQYINPERDVEQGAFEVHGISDEFLSDKPKFSDIVKAFLDFIKDSELIIHNAPFDVGFINHELNLLSAKHGCVEDYARVLDTLVLARKRHPGQKNNLDALCKRYDVDNSNRQLHGALLDAEILAHLYLAMTGGQTNLFNAVETYDSNNENFVEPSIVEKSTRAVDLVILRANHEEQKAHQQYLDFLEKQSGVRRWDDD